MSVEINNYDIIIGQPVINREDIMLTVKGGKVNLYLDSNHEENSNFASKKTLCYVKCLFQL